ncbi:MAG: IS200/IS605 family transposase [Thermoanaerobaculia bacterium]
MPSTHTSLHCHVTFATKSRNPWIRADIRSRVHEYIGGCLLRHGAQPLIVGGVEDHVHLLFGFAPSVCISDLMHDVKKPVTDWIRAEFGVREFTWQEGFGAFTVSRSALDRVQEYITTQEEHHRHVTFQEEYLLLLQRHGIAYDERYLW